MNVSGLVAQVSLTSLTAYAAGVVHWILRAKSLDAVEVLSHVTFLLVLLTQAQLRPLMVGLDAVMVALGAFCFGLAYGKRIKQSDSDIPVVGLATTKGAVSSETTGADSRNSGNSIDGKVDGTPTREKGFMDLTRKLKVKSKVEGSKPAPLTLEQPKGSNDNGSPIRDRVGSHSSDISRDIVDRNRISSGNGAAQFLSKNVDVVADGNGKLVSSELDTTTVSGSDAQHRGTFDDKEENDDDDVQLARNFSERNLVTRVRESVAQQAAAGRSAMDVTTDLARQTIFAIMGLPGVSSEIADQYKSRQWLLLRSRGDLHLWAAQQSTKKCGIMLKGRSFSDRPVTDVLQCLLQEGQLTGFEGLSYAQEVQFRTTETGSNNEVDIRRLICKSSSFNSAKRDFTVVTCVSTLEDGTTIISSRSLPDDFELTAKTRKDKRGYIRGLCFASGYILHPLKASEGGGCEVSYASHVNMMGAGNANQLRQSDVANRVFATLELLSNTSFVTSGSSATNEARDAALSGGETPSSPDGTWKDTPSPGRGPPLNYKVNVTAKGVDPLVDLKESVDAADSEADTDTDAPVCATAPMLEEAQIKECVHSSSHALSQLRRLHCAHMASYRSSVDSSDQDSSSSSSSSSSSIENDESWRVFHNDDGVTVKELPESAGVPLGVLSASCSTPAPPHVVRMLLLEQPGAVDAILEGRAMLGRLDAHTYIQYLAYGAIWPIGARDYLVVTTEDAYDSQTGEGFIIASTSIDHICEVEGGAELGLDKTYARSTLRLAGYVGVKRADGGTDVTMFVDTGVGALVPGWLLRMLAQYGLSEMMTRIVTVTTPFKGMVPPSKDRVDMLLNQVQRRDSFSLEQRDIFSSPEEKVRSGQRTHRASLNQGAFNSILENVHDGDEEVSLAACEKNEKSAEGDQGKLTEEEVNGGIDGGNGSSSSNVSGDGNNNIPLAQCTRPAREQPLDHFITEYNSVKKEAYEYMLTLTGMMKDSRGLHLRWEKKATNHGIIIYSTRIKGSDWNSIKGTCCMRAGKEKIRALVMDDSRMAEYDDMFDRCTFLHQLDDHTAVRLVQMKGIWPTAPREFLLCSSWVERSDGSLLIFSRSPSNQTQKQSAGYVRGFISCSGYLIQPYECFSSATGGAEERPAAMEPGMCMVTLCAHTELGGTLPSSIVNSLSTGAPIKLLQAISAVSTR